ncbi:hypothetical protein BG58_04780 [Caballeronia jiangsuensis]|nr:hypothetical protein BG58_04780 [Caballeronia jiangsuensis]
MMYDIACLTKLEDEYRRAVRSHFADFFKSHNYEKPRRKVELYPLDSFESAQKACYGNGVYVILTDMDVGANPCRFELEGFEGNRSWSLRHGESANLESSLQP